MGRTHSRDEGQFEVVSSCDTRHGHLNVEEDGRHDDVIHVTLMAWEEHQRHTMLSRRGEERRGEERRGEERRGEGRGGEARRGEERRGEERRGEERRYAKPCVYP